MKERLIKGWTFTRILYLIMGIIIVIQAALQQQWYGMVLGLYFLAMGLFSLGCASGACYGESCDVKLKERKSEDAISTERR